MVFGFSRLRTQSGCERMFWSRATHSGPSAEKNLPSQVSKNVPHFVCSKLDLPLTQDAIVESEGLDWGPPDPKNVTIESWWGDD